MESFAAPRKKCKIATVAARGFIGGTAVQDRVSKMMCFLGMRSLSAVTPSLPTAVVTLFSVLRAGGGGGEMLVHFCGCRLTW